jgi:ferritin-like metal-binding protein YciE
MSLHTMQDLFVEKLEDIHDAEKRITEALPRMIAAAKSEDLKAALQDHLEVTEQQIERLQQVFDHCGEAPAKKTCHGMVGLLEEGDEVIAKEAPDVLKDVALIAAAQGVEHYEISSYGCLKEWADLLGKHEDAALLQQSLDEEKDADARLTEVAATLNAEAFEAVGGDADEDEEDEERMTGTTGRRSSGAQRSGPKSGRR